MPVLSVDSFKTQSRLDSKKGEFFYANLKILEHQGLVDMQKLPCLLKLLLENLIQHEDDESVNKLDIKALARATNHISRKAELAFHPVRLWLENTADISSVAAVAACQAPLGSSQALKVKTDWIMSFPGQHTHTFFDSLLEQMKAVSNFQINSSVSCNWLHITGQRIFQESLVGTGDNIAIANALGILALKVSSLAAESVMLNQPLYLPIPEILGVKLEGTRRKEIQSEVYVANILQQLKKEGIAGRWVEFYGNGLDQLSYQERVSIAKEAMSLGALCAFFPVDQKTLQQLSEMLQDSEMVELIEAYVLAQGLWRDNTTPEPVFNDSLVLDFSQLASEAWEDSIQKPQLNSAIEEAIEISSIELPSPLPEMDQFYLKQIRVLFPEQGGVSDMPFAMMTDHVNNTIFADGITRNAISGSMKVVLAEAFDPVLRADLIRLGIMPLLFKFGMSRDSLQIEGDEALDFVNLSRQMKPGMDILCRMTRKSGEIEEFVLKCGIETSRELAYFRCGGVLGYVLRKDLKPDS